MGGVKAANSPIAPAAQHPARKGVLRLARNIYVVPREAIQARLQQQARPRGLLEGRGEGGVGSLISNLESLKW